MTTPLNATMNDEMESLRLFMAAVFSSLEIRTERPEKESEPYDILIETPAEMVSNMRGTYLSDRTMPVTIQQWVSGMTSARTAAEDTDLAFRSGTTVGVIEASPSRVPVFDFSTAEADPTTDPPIYFMRVDDVSTRILAGDKPGEWVVVTDVRLLGWRVTKTYTVDSSNEVLHVEMPRFIPPA